MAESFNLDLPEPGDLPDDEFRAALYRAADLLGEYLRTVNERPVLPAAKPGDVRRQLPMEPPHQPEPLKALLTDFERIILPGLTHWNHPGFLAYFANTGSVPGIIGELLTAGVNVNAMLWKASPAATELEEHVCDWVRRMIGLPTEFTGHINDTASSSTLVALAAARQSASGVDVRYDGLAGSPPQIVYCGEQAHSSVDKAIITLGIGLKNLRKIPVDDDFRMKTSALAEAIAADRAVGRTPIAVVATIGTTSSTSVDLTSEVAAICRRERLWLHVDAAYAGSAAICPEMRGNFAGWEQASSVVINPHKWLFTPVDCSLLFARDPETLRSAFALTPEYLRTASGATNLMDYGPQLGRRFRSLKLWFVIRAYGVDGLRQRIRAHCRLASELAERIRAEPEFEVVAPVPFSTVCFRARPAGVAEADIDDFNERLMHRVNEEGSVFLSHTKLRGFTVIRVAIGNIRTNRATIERAWDCIRGVKRAMERGF